MVGRGTADSHVVRMQSGVRGAVERSLQQHGGALRQGSASAMVALLSAGALAPVAAAAAAGAGAVSLAAIGVVSGVGGNILTDVINGVVRRLRSGQGPADKGNLRDPVVVAEQELFVELVPLLDSGDATGQGLRAEVARLLDDVGAARLAMDTVISRGDAAMRDLVVASLARIGTVHHEFAHLVNEVRWVLDEVTSNQTRILHLQQDAVLARRCDRDLARTQLMEIRILRETVEQIARNGVPLAGPAPVGNPPAVRNRTTGCPYRGLWPFTENHTEVFFGRERVTAQLLGRISERLAGPSLVVVTGASGAGKSSLLRAGLIPAVARGDLGVPGSTRWPRLVLTPTTRPLEELASRLSDLTGTDLTATFRTLRDEPEQAHLVVREALQTLARRSRSASGSRVVDLTAVESPGRLVLVVDQFEEVFTLAEDPDGDPGQVAPFLTALVTAATTPCGPEGRPAAVVVLGVRGDCWDRCAANGLLAPLLQDGQFTLTPMTPEQLRLAITGPAGATGLQIDDELVTVILQDLVSRSGDGVLDSGALPLLSQAMLLTWEHREGVRLTATGYAHSGGVAGAIHTSASQAYQALPSRRQRVARRVLTALTSITPDGTFARRRMTIDDLVAGGGGRGTDQGPSREDTEAVVEAFTTKRLLVRDGDWVEIAHDVLLRSWPLLQDWLRHDRDGLARYSHLVDEATRWHAGGRDSSLLFRGTELDAVRGLVERWRQDLDRYPPLAGTTEAFLAASHRADTRSRWQRRLFTSTLATLLAIAVATTGLAFSKARDTDRLHRLALSRQLSLQADSLAVADPGMSRLLAATALQFAPTAEARFSARNNLVNSRTVLTGHTQGVTALAFHPSGRLLASAAEEGVVRLWDPTTRRPLGPPLTGHTRAVNALAFSPDGRTLATASTDRTIRLWDPTTRRPLGPPLTGHTRAVYGVAITPDGKTLATASDDRTIRLWDTATGRRLGRPLTGHTSYVSQLAFAPDGHTLASAGDDCTVRLWDLTTRSRHSRLLGGHTQPVNAIAFSPDGHTLATAGTDRTVRLWDPSSHSQLVTGHTEGLYSVEFSPDGKTLATASTDNTVRLWDLTTRRQRGRPLPTRRQGVNAVTFGPDGRTLATAGNDSTVRLWDLTTRRQRGTALVGRPDSALIRIAVSPDGRTLATTGSDQTVRLWDAVDHTQSGPPLTGHTDYVFGIAFSPDGRTLATAGNDRTTRLWDVATRQQLGQPLTGHTQPVHAVAFSPDGRTLATASWDTTVRLWDVATRHQLGQPLTGHTDYVFGVAFSPDGRTLATAGNDHTARLWDVATRQQLGQPLTGHTQGVNAVAFSPDGRTLATAGNDQAIRLWDSTSTRDLSPAAQVRELCAVAGRVMSRQEWNAYLPNDPPRPVC